MDKNIQYHFVGIGGMGMSALAFLMAKKGFFVSGSDLKSFQMEDRLKKAGIKIFVGHSQDRIKPNMAIVYSSAVNSNNPEMKAAKSRNLKIYHRSEILAWLTLEKTGILVAGTHGKTTVSSLLAFVLKQAGLDPSYAIGGIFDQHNARLGKKEILIAEADESDGSFLKYFPAAAIITNIENDHLEYWKSLDRLKIGFSKFVRNIFKSRKLKLPYKILWCYQDAALQEIMQDKQTLSYGFHKKAGLQAFNLRFDFPCTQFDIRLKKQLFKDVKLNLIGRHNVLNSLAVFGMALQLGITPEQIKTAFKHFPGVERRLQTIAKKQEILFLQDYGHHPTEIKTVLASLKSLQTQHKKQILCVFQPHRYSRIQNLFEEFAAAFQNADELIVTDIYSAFEKKTKINAQILAKAISQKQKKVCYAPEQKLFTVLKKKLKKNQIVLFLGAGDIFEKGKNFVKTI